VLHHLSQGRDGEIGLGATTVIIESKSRGLKFVGPLPEEIQNFTTYVAAVAAQGAGREFIDYLASPAARAVLAAAGIE